MMSQSTAPRCAVNPRHAAFYYDVQACRTTMYQLHVCVKLTIWPRDRRHHQIKDAISMVGRSMSGATSCVVGTKAMPLCACSP